MSTATWAFSPQSWGVGGANAELNTMHTKLLKSIRDITLAPLAPRHLLQVGEPAQRSGSQFWGELAQDSVFLQLVCHFYEY
jgi:hypothetical protein